VYSKGEVFLQDLHGREREDDNWEQIIYNSALEHSNSVSRVKSHCYYEYVHTDTQRGSL